MIAMFALLTTKPLNCHHGMMQVGTATRVFGPSPQRESPPRAANESRQAPLTNDAPAYPHGVLALRVPRRRLASARSARSGLAVRHAPGAGRVPRAPRLVP